MIVEKSCCYCKHRESKQELTQDRLDVDIVHYCMKLDDRLYRDFGRTSDCQEFELHDELKNTAAYHGERIRILLGELLDALVGNFWKIYTLAWITGLVLITLWVIGMM